MLVGWALAPAAAQELDAARLNCQILRAAGTACETDDLVWLRRENAVLRERVGALEAEASRAGAQARLDRALAFLADSARRRLSRGHFAEPSGRVQRRLRADQRGQGSVPGRGRETC